MQSFLDLELPSKSERHVARRIGRKTMFFVQKISNMQRLLQISWNSSWTFSIKSYDGPKMPQPISRVHHAPFASFMPSLIFPLNSLFVPCKLYSLPCNEKPCVSEMPCPCQPCLAVSLSGFWPSQAKSLDQALSPAEWVPSHLGFFGQPWRVVFMFLSPLWGLLGACTSVGESLWVSSSYSYEESDAITTNE